MQRTRRAKGKPSEPHVLSWSVGDCLAAMFPRAAATNRRGVVARIVLERESPGLYTLTISTAAEERRRKK